MPGLWISLDKAALVKRYENFVDNGFRPSQFIAEFRYGPFGLFSRKGAENANRLEN